jgi:hypothetical protein
MIQIYLSLLFIVFNSILSLKQEPFYYNINDNITINIIDQQMSINFADNHEKITLNATQVLKLNDYLIILESNGVFKVNLNNLSKQSIDLFKDQPLMLIKLNDTNIIICGYENKQVLCKQIDIYLDLIVHEYNDYYLANYLLNTRGNLNQKYAFNYGNSIFITNEYDSNLFLSRLSLKRHELIELHPNWNPRRNSKRTFTHIHF